MKIGITLEVLRPVGKIPVWKERLMRKETGENMSWWTSFRILTGKLLGPEDLLELKEQIIFETSFGVTGDKKIDSRLGFLR